MNAAYLIFALIVAAGLVVYAGLSHFSDSQEAQAKYVFRLAYLDFKELGTLDARFNSMLPKGYKIVQSGSCLVLKKGAEVVEREC